MNVVIPVESCLIPVELSPIPADSCGFQRNLAIPAGMGGASRSTVVDVESKHHEQHTQSELDPLIQCNVKVSTKEESNVARAQVLALCWSMFVLGWTNRLTGPLLLRIQNFYDVSSLRWPTALTILSTSLFFMSG